MLNINEKWKCTVRLNGDAINFRECIADKLRRLAEVIDGRLTAAIDMQSTPSISVTKKNHCFTAGFNHCERLFEDEVKTEAIEHGLKKACPKLFEVNMEKSNK